MFHPKFISLAQVVPGPIQPWQCIKSGLKHRSSIQLSWLAPQELNHLLVAMSHWRRIIRQGDCKSIFTFSPTGRFCPADRKWWNGRVMGIKGPCACYESTRQDLALFHVFADHDCEELAELSPLTLKGPSWEPAVCCCVVAAAYTYRGGRPGPPKCGFKVLVTTIDIMMHSGRGWRM